MGQGQSWGTVTVSARLASETWSEAKTGHSTVSVRLASGIWPELSRVQHSSSQILHHTCEAQLKILYALVINYYHDFLCGLAACLKLLKIVSRCCSHSDVSAFVLQDLWLLIRLQM